MFSKRLKFWYYMRRSMKWEPTRSVRWEYPKFKREPTNLGLFPFGTDGDGSNGVGVGRAAGASEANRQTMDLLSRTTAYRFPVHRWNLTNANDLRLVRSRVIVIICRRHSERQPSGGSKGREIILDPNPSLRNQTFILYVYLKNACTVHKFLVLLFLFLQDFSYHI